MPQKNFSVRLILTLILIALFNIGCRGERERWRAKMWLPSITAHSIVSADKMIIPCESPEMLRFFCARLEDATSLEVLLERCKSWGAPGKSPPLFDFSVPKWRVRTWLPHPNSGSIVSASGQKISCTSPSILGFFCAELTTLNQAEQLLNQCEEWM